MRYFFLVFCFDFLSFTLCVILFSTRTTATKKNIISFLNYTFSFALLYRSWISLIFFVCCCSLSLFFDRWRFHSDCGDDKTLFKGGTFVCACVWERCSLSQQALSLKICWPKEFSSLFLWMHTANNRICFFKQTYYTTLFLSVSRFLRGRCVSRVFLSLF